MDSSSAGPKTSAYPRPRVLSIIEVAKHASAQRERLVALAFRWGEADATDLTGDLFEAMSAELARGKLAFSSTTSVDLWLERRLAETIKLREARPSGDALDYAVPLGREALDASVTPEPGGSPRRSRPHLGRARALLRRLDVGDLMILAEAVLASESEELSATERQLRYAAAQRRARRQLLRLGHRSSRSILDG